MARPGSETNLKLVQGGYGGLRGWIEQVEKLGELKRVSGAHWDTEMGAVTHMLTEHSHGTAPALLFDDVPGFPKGYRTLYGHFSSIKRVALTLGLPLERERKVDIVKQYYDRIQTMKHIPPRVVKDGPILENVLTGDQIDVLKFPVPRHHEQDKARYIGTANCVITQDPDAGWFNLGCYRNQVYDGKTIGCQITEGKHGRIHRDKYFARGQSMKVVVLVGQDPLLFMLAASPLPDGISELDFAGGLRGEPIEVIKGPYTGFPIPADAESRSNARPCPDRCARKGRSASGWATTPPGPHGGAAVSRREDHSSPERPDPHLRARQACGRDRPAQGHRRRGPDLALARGLRHPRHPGRMEPRGGARDPVHRGAEQYVTNQA